MNLQETIKSLASKGVEINEASGDKEAYQKFFNGMLKKFGVKSASELSDDKKKEFYDAIDAGWEGDNEVKESAELDEVFSQAQMKKAIGIARNSAGNYDKAYAQIEKIKKGLGDEHIVANALKKANESVEIEEAKEVSLAKSGKYDLLAVGKNAVGIQLMLRYNRKMVVTGSKKDGLFIMAFKKIDGNNKLPNGAKVITTGEWVHIGFKKADDVIAYAKFGDITEDLELTNIEEGFNLAAIDYNKLKDYPAFQAINIKKMIKANSFSKFNPTTIQDIILWLNMVAMQHKAGNIKESFEEERNMKTFKQLVQENVDKAMSTLDSAAPSDALAENIEDRHADAWIRFEKYESKLSKKQKKEFYAANDSFDEGYEDDDDDQMDDALDDMLTILKKAKIPKK